MIDRASSNWIASTSAAAIRSWSPSRAPPPTVVVQVSQVAVVLPRIEQDQVGEGAKLESPVDPERVVRLDLALALSKSAPSRAVVTHRPNREPLKVRLDRVRLALREARAVVAASDGVVAVGRAGLPRVVRDLVVVPDQLPRVRLVQELQVEVGPVRLVSRAVLVERPDLVVGLRDPVAGLSGGASRGHWVCGSHIPAVAVAGGLAVASVALVLVAAVNTDAYPGQVGSAPCQRHPHVVADVHGVVDGVSSGSIAVGVEKAEGVVGARVDAEVSVCPLGKTVCLQLHCWLVTHANETESTSASSSYGIVLNRPTGLTLFLSAQLAKLR